MLASYVNGNAHIEIYPDGKRVITYDGELKLDMPLNIDIRVSNKCSFGQRPDGTYVLCSFCHEEAKTDGNECDYELLKAKLYGLPKGIELAIGANNITGGLKDFLMWCNMQGYISNLTINQGHLRRDMNHLMYLIDNDYIKGLGVSFRSGLKWDMPEEILAYPNTVFHVICGIDTISDVIGLAARGVKKVLILGEKDFGFNAGKVNTQSQVHKTWLWHVRSLFDIFDVVSFDNLALEQLRVNRFFTNSDWKTFNQGEHSFYIDAVRQVYKPSSRDKNECHWNIDIKEYFKQLNYE